MPGWDFHPQGERALRGAREALAAAKGRSTVHQGAALASRLLAFPRHHLIAPGPVNINSLLEAVTEMFGRMLGADIHIAKRLAEDWRTSIRSSLLF